MFFHPQSGTVRIHGLSLSDEIRPSMPDDFETNIASYRSTTHKFNDLFIEGTIREAQRGARIVLWPKMVCGGTEEDANALIARAKEVTQQKNIYLVMGVQIRFFDSDRLMENRLIIIDPTGEIIVNHLKYGATSIDNIAPGDGLLR